MTIAKEFNIGDRVKLREYADIPTESRNQGMARCCGKVGTITTQIALMDTFTPLSLTIMMPLQRNCGVKIASPIT